MGSQLCTFHIIDPDVVSFMTTQAPDSTTEESSTNFGESIFRAVYGVS